MGVDVFGNYRRSQFRDYSIERRKTLDLWRQQKVNCAYCHKGLSGKEITLDHIVALSKGGTRTYSNYAPACTTCQITKNHNDLSTFSGGKKKIVRNIILHCLGTGKMPHEAWQLCRSRSITAGVLIFNMVLEIVANEYGFEPFDFIEQEWPLPEGNE